MTEGINLDPKTEAVFKRKGYRILRRLAAGAFGQVYTAQKIGTNEEICAVKVMELQKCSKNMVNKFIPRELAALINIKHPNVIYIFDIFQCNYKIYIFMEYASNGDLAGYLKKNGAMNEPDACKWFTQVVSALAFIHDELHIAHRDIKIDNILLTNRMEPKLTDFGFAKYTVDDNNEVILSETYCGTEPYYSPQIACHKPYNPYCADVWAMGVVLFAMLNNKFPFHFGDRKVMFREQSTYPSHIRSRFIRQFSRNYMELNERMFNPSETLRITVHQIISHPWVVRRGR